jgi:hypothetical protein
MLPDRSLLACTGRADEMCVDSWRPAHQQARQERIGKAICADCPTIDRCRAWVLAKPDDPSPVMVVGGMTPGERRRAKFGSEACGTDWGWQRHRRDGQTACAACAAAHNEATKQWQRQWREKNRKGAVA